MTKFQTTLVSLAVVAVVALSFQLGWSMRGDEIYGGLINGTAAKLHQLPQ